MYFAEARCLTLLWTGFSSGASYSAKERPIHSPGLWFFSPCGKFKDWHWDYWSFTPVAHLFIYSHCSVQILIHSDCVKPLCWPQTRCLLSEVFIYRIGNRGGLDSALLLKGDFAAVSGAWPMCVCYTCRLSSEGLHPLHQNSYVEVLMPVSTGISRWAFGR